MFQGTGLIFPNGVAAPAPAAGVTILDMQDSLPDIANTIALTQVYSTTIPGNTLGTKNLLRISQYAEYLNNTAGSRSLRFQLKLGATTLYDDIFTGQGPDPDRAPVPIQWWLKNDASRIVQVGGGLLNVQTPGTVTTGIGDLASATATTKGQGWAASAEDTANNLALVFSIAHDAASANVLYAPRFWCVELLQAP